MRRLYLSLTLLLVAASAFGQNPSVQAPGRVGPLPAQDGSTPALRLSKDTSTVTQESHARYQEAVYRGNVYMLSTTAANPTGAFPFAAAGTPLLAVYNPPGSGKIFVVLAVGIGVETTGSASATEDFGFSVAGVTAIGTGTVTAPTNMLSYQQTGSVGKGFVNTALTSNTLSTSVSTLPIISLGVQPATAAVVTAPALFPVDGMIEVIPGNIVTLGAAATLTSGKIDATLIWEEIPQ